MPNSFKDKDAMNKMTPEEMDDLWKRVRPLCVERGITRDQFKWGMRIIESIETPEQSEELVRAIAEAGERE